MIHSHLAARRGTLLAFGEPRTPWNRPAQPRYRPCSFTRRHVCCWPVALTPMPNHGGLVLNRVDFAAKQRPSTQPRIFESTRRLAHRPCSAMIEAALTHATAGCLVPSSDGERISTAECDTTETSRPPTGTGGRKTIDYLLSWLSTRRETAPRSEAAGATIGARWAKNDAWVILLDRMARPPPSTRCSGAVLRDTPR